jgi:excisionase family DNA binding protein
MPANGTHNPAAHDAILTKAQASEYLQVSTRWLETAARQGRIKVYKPSPQLWRVRRSELDAFLESGSTIGVAE